MRSTHGVNCTGGCSWWVYVKNGIVTWEMQALDYPRLDPGLPPYEPRGCQRGISASWYVYSPLRIKHPYVRGPLVGVLARARGARMRTRWPPGRPSSRIRRSAGRISARAVWAASVAPSWDECVELIAASMLYTAKKYGPDRVIGFSPIPAMSMVSYAAGSRLLQLFGGAVLSFYDMYADFPPASPETWGEKTDVAGVGRLVQQQVHRHHRQQPQHDAHARRALRRRSAQPRREARGAVARLQPGVEVRRLVDSGQCRHGRRVLDGRHSRHPQGVPRRSARSRTSPII